MWIGHSQIWMCHATRMNVSCHMGPGAHVNEAWGTYEWVTSHKCQTILYFSSSMTSFGCVTSLIHTCAMIHSCKWHNSLICVRWLIDMRGTTHTRCSMFAWGGAYCFGVGLRVYTYFDRGRWFGGKLGGLAWRDFFMCVYPQSLSFWRLRALLVRSGACSVYGRGRGGRDRVIEDCPFLWKENERVGCMCVCECEWEKRERWRQRVREKNRDRERKKECCIKTQCHTQCHTYQHAMSHARTNTHTSAQTHSVTVFIEL